MGCGPSKDKSRERTSSSKLVADKRTSEHVKPYLDQESAPLTHESIRLRFAGDEDLDLLSVREFRVAILVCLAIVRLRRRRLFRRQLRSQRPGFHGEAQPLMFSTPPPKHGHGLQHSLFDDAQPQMLTPPVHTLSHAPPPLPPPAYSPDSTKESLDMLEDHQITSHDSRNKPEQESSFFSAALATLAIAKMRNGADDRRTRHSPLQLSSLEKARLRNSMNKKSAGEVMFADTENAVATPPLNSLQKARLRSAMHAPQKSDSCSFGNDDFKDDQRPHLVRSPTPALQSPRRSHEITQDSSAQIGSLKRRPKPTPLMTVKKLQNGNDVQYVQKVIDKTGRSPRDMAISDSGSGVESDRVCQASPFRVAAQTCVAVVRLKKGMCRKDVVKSAARLRCDAKVPAGASHQHHGMFNGMQEREASRFTIAAMICLAVVKVKRGKGDRREFTRKFVPKIQIVPPINDVPLSTQFRVSPTSQAPASSKGSTQDSLACSNASPLTVVALTCLAVVKFKRRKRTRRFVPQDAGPGSFAMHRNAQSAASNPRPPPLASPHGAPVTLHPPAPQPPESPPPPLAAASTWLARFFHAHLSDFLAIGVCAYAAGHLSGPQALLGG